MADSGEGRRCRRTSPASTRTRATRSPRWAPRCRCSMSRPRSALRTWQPVRKSSRVTPSRPAHSSSRAVFRTGRSPGASRRCGTTAGCGRAAHRSRSTRTGSIGGLTCSPSSSTSQLNSGHTSVPRPRALRALLDSGFPAACGVSLGTGTPHVRSSLPASNQTCDMEGHAVQLRQEGHIASRCRAP